MAEQNPKRQREENEFHELEEEDSKRFKSYDQIISILEEEQEDPIEDLSDIFTILQQEISSDDSATGLASPEAESDDQNSGGTDEEDSKIRMMRHLLEASDDELGIPNRVESGDEEVDSGGGDGGYGGGEKEEMGYLGGGLWEFEDETANYYALLQSELFM